MSPGPDRNPYDTFFHQAFGEPEAARELALNLVPTEYAKAISAGRITVEGNHFVDGNMRNRYSDLLIRVEGDDDRPGVGRDADGLPHEEPPGNDTPDLLVYVLVEHKSNPDRWVAMQMLRYLVLIWDDERRKHGDSRPLPRIVPVVIYHGTRAWSGATDFAELVDGTIAGDRHVPHFRPFLVNLANLTEAQLLGSLRTITALLFLKYVKHSLHRVGKPLLKVLQRGHEDPRSREMSRLGMRMLAAVKDRKEMEYLQTIAREGRYDRVQEDEMTYAEELLQEGLEKGVLIQRRAILIRQLSRRFSLNDDERTRIESCEDRDALDAALDEFAIAASKEAVLKKLL